MPGERRNLRSNKESSSSTNGEKARSNSQSSGSSKDRPVPTRAASSKGKTTSAKRSSAKEGNGEKLQINGTEPIENGTNGIEDVDMVDDGPEKIKDGDDEMTVVVPPPKSSKLSGDPGKVEEGDTTMLSAEKVQGSSLEEELMDPKAKAVAGQWNIKLATTSSDYVKC